MLMIACLPLSSSLHVAFTSLLSVAVYFSDMSNLNVSEKSFSQVCSTNLNFNHDPHHSTSPSQLTTNTPPTPLPFNHTHNPGSKTCTRTTQTNVQSKTSPIHTTQCCTKKKPTMYSARSRKNVLSKRRPFSRSVVEKVLFDKHHCVGRDAEAKTFGE